ncbi:hypothetical protein TCON_0899 [Astathelohania contejeani]|uniref:NADH dehydrogenase subunit 6 n=1 Tax=Astathelohania contejeani TaxID=164912 RepID=A0ABQ7I0F4_9MICR|nr:hypothetical protein TCON_0899 [Thelohania contejeani]
MAEISKITLLTLLPITAIVTSIFAMLSIFYNNYYTTPLVTKILVILTLLVIIVITYLHRRIKYRTRLYFGMLGLHILVFILCISPFSICNVDKEEIVRKIIADNKK